MPLEAAPIPAVIGPTLEAIGAATAVPAAATATGMSAEALAGLDLAYGGMGLPAASTYTLNPGGALKAGMIGKSMYDLVEGSPNQPQPPGTPPPQPQKKPLIPLTESPARANSIISSLPPEMRQQ